MSKNHIDADPTSTSIATAPSRLRRAAPSLAAAVAGSLALAGCSPEAAPEKPEITNISVLGTELPADLAKTRQAVLELCDTGPGAEEMNKIWVEAGFEESTGKKWIEALTFDADFGYEDAQSVIDNGSYTYPTTLAVAENCPEAALIISQGVRLAATKDALAAVEAFRENGNPNDIILQIYEDNKSSS